LRWCGPIQVLSDTFFLSSPLLFSILLLYNHCDTTVTPEILKKRDFEKQNQKRKTPNL
jgi:hypothetical protein